MTYEDWLKELNNIACDEFDFEEDDPFLEDDEIWMDYFDEGFFPRDALLEELDDEQ